MPLVEDAEQKLAELRGSCLRHWVDRDQLAWWQEGEEGVGVEG